jgi:LAS superfamily LD-carboxypeptidase LdcB
MPRRRLAALVVLALLGASTTAALADQQEPRTVDGYRNGRRIKIKVITLDWADVEVKTARAFEAMRAAAALDGVELMIRSGFRSHEDQTMFYEAWRAGWGNRAARPGYSNHQSGSALDITLWHTGAFAWLEANARRFGFKRTVKNEPWHWEYSKRYVEKPRKRKVQARKAKPR